VRGDVVHGLAKAGVEVVAVGKVPLDLRVAAASGEMYKR